MCGLLYMFCMQFLFCLSSISWYFGALTLDLFSLFLMLVFGMLDTSSDDLPLWGMHITHSGGYI